MAKYIFILKIFILLIIYIIDLLIFNVNVLFITNYSDFHYLIAEVT